MNGLTNREENYIFYQDSSLLDTVVGISPRYLHFPENK